MPNADPPSPTSMQVDAAHAGKTVAAVVRELVPETSWRVARERIERGEVTVDGATVRDPAQRLLSGQTLALAVGGVGPIRERESLLVHLDADIAVARKPAGLLTVPFPGLDEPDTLRDRLAVAVRRYERAHGIRGGSSSLRTVQRLDQETSGLLVFARTVAAERALQEQLAERVLERSYLALAHGEVAAARFESWLVRDRGDGLRGSVAVVGPAPAGAKLAVTEVEPRARHAWYEGGGRRGRRHLLTLVRCRLETGRTHQIRIHLAEAGHPVVGEPVYVRDFPGPWYPAPRLLLHAAELAFRHPRSGVPLRFREPLPADFAAVLEGLERCAEGG